MASKPKQKKAPFPPGKHPGGRPSIYTHALASRICKEIADGKSMRKICKAADMPDMSSVFDWLRIHKEFSEQYAKAKEEQAEAMIEDMLEIADNTHNDTIIVEKLDGEIIEKENKEWINRSRLRVDTRKWIASKLKPKKYGDKVEHEVKAQSSVTGLILDILKAEKKTDEQKQPEAGVAHGN